MLRGMTIIEWKEQADLSYAEIAKKLGLGSGGFMQVYRHANFETEPGPAMIQNYIKISGGLITLADLIKPSASKSRRKS
jgi:hypothetical protein